MNRCLGNSRLLICISLWHTWHTIMAVKGRHSRKGQDKICITSNWFFYKQLQCFIVCLYHYLLLTNDSISGWGPLWYSWLSFYCSTMTKSIYGQRNTTNMRASWYQTSIFVHSSQITSGGHPTPISAWLLLNSQTLPMSLEKDTLHVVIRLPFKRPQGFIEPPQVIIHSLFWHWPILECLSSPF